MLNFISSSILISIDIDRKLIESILSVPINFYILFILSYWFIYTSIVPRSDDVITAKSIRTLHNYLKLL